MQRVIRPAVVLSLLVSACASDSGHSSGTHDIAQDRNNTQQAPSEPVLHLSTDGGGPLIVFTTVVQNASGTRPSDAGLGGLDAGPGAPQGGGDPGNDAAVSALYACQQNSDCQVKNVFSCCGFFPRCANTAANFSPPDCSQGQIGVCSLPLIDHCECRQNACVDVQSVTAN